ncbi:MAG: transcriptional repressor [Candidatus Levybacteria bacterium]|nr:transcriptional repressor [Candidatus Levybacteria bacterium]
MNIQHNCSDELRQIDLKATPARIAVLQLLEKSDTPLDVASIIVYLQKNDVEIDPATAFRIVNMFTEKGIITPIQFNEGKLRYELSSKAAHHHLVCEHCGNIEDISDCNIKELEKEIQKKKGFVVKHHSLEFFGLCRNCQK